MKQKVIIIDKRGSRLVEMQLIPVVTNTVSGERAITAPPPARYWLHQVCREAADQYFLRVSLKDGR